MEARKEKLSLNPIQYLGQLLRWLLLIAILFFSLFSINQLKLSRYFFIRTVRIHGINRVDQADVKKLLLPLVDHGFFSVNVGDIKDRLLQMPWISDLYVRRNWPDQVDITLIERTPIALWNGKSLLSTSGEIFTPDPKTYPNDLAQFVGPEGQQITMLKFFDEINRLFLPLHAKISNLELTPYFTWKVVLSNGITLQLGHKDIYERLNQFVSVYPKIIGEHATDVDYVDLRYPNGIAVRWKQPIKNLS